MPHCTVSCCMRVVVAACEASSTAPAYRVALAVSDVGSRPDKVLALFLDLDDEIDILLGAVDACRRLQTSFHGAEDVESLELVCELPCRLQDVPEGARRWGRR